MQVAKKHRKSEQGATLVTSMVLSLILCTVTGSFLNVLVQEYKITHRSHNYASAINLAEAGIEEAICMLNYGQSNWTGAGWTQSNGTNYTKTVTNVTPNASSDPVGSYSITVYGATNEYPLIVASATTVADYSGSALNRTVRAQLKRRPTFHWGLLAQNRIDMNGNNLKLDSFDSSDPTASNWDASKGYGTYNSAKRKDNGDAATNSGLTNSISAGNADIYGRVATGPGGTVSIGPGGFVGTISNHTSGVINPDRISHSVYVDLPAGVAPFSSGISLGAIVNSTTLSGGAGMPVDYVTPSISLSGSKVLTFAGGYTRIYVSGDISVSGLASIAVAEGAKVEIYVSGAVLIAGNGLVNHTNRAENFQLYVVGSQNVSISGNGNFVGVVYAPRSNVSLDGGGTTGDVVGAIVGNLITLNGHMNFHYDEALRKMGPFRGWNVVSWEER
jgi:Tfp pilus assembly protein PilX